MLLHPRTPGQASAWTPVTWTIAAVAIAGAVLEHAAGEALSRAGPSPAWAEAVADWAARARLYPDEALFEPWQPWSHVLVQEGWWQLAAGVLGLLASAGVLEGELGGAALAILLIVSLPLAAAGTVLGGGEPGLSTLVIACFAAALARRPFLQLRWGLSYYAITEVGHVPLLRMPLALAAAIYLSSELWRCHFHQITPPALGWLGAAAAGACLGVVSRRLLPPLAEADG